MDALVALEYLASGHDFALLLVERRAAARAGGGVGHDERDRVAVARFDRSVRILAGADAFHPVAHVRRGKRIAAGVGARNHRLLRSGKRFGSRLLSFDAFVGDHARSHIDAAVRAEILLDGRLVIGLGAAAAVVLVRLEHDLEALALHAGLAVFHDGGEGVEALTSVNPLVETAGGDGALRIGHTHEPCDGVDLVAHPLPGHARRERPEETELEILARIERIGFGIAVEKPEVPVDVLLFEALDELFALAPAAGLVDVPSEMHVGNVAELAGIDEFLRGHVLLAAAALGADLENGARSVAGPALGVDRVEQHIRRIHILGERLFAVGVLAGVDGVGRVLGVLEVGGRNDDRVDVLGLLVKLDVGNVGVDLVTDLRFDLRTRLFIETLAPEVGHGDEIEVELLVVVHEARQERTAETVGITYAGDADALVGAGGVEGRRRAGGENAGHADCGSFAEVAT